MLIKVYALPTHFLDHWIIISRLSGICFDIKFSVNSLSPIKKLKAH